MKVGSKSYVDPLVRVYGDGPVVIGDRSRIDAEVVISSGKGVYIGDNVHLSRGAMLCGGSGLIEIADFVGIAADVKIYTASEDPWAGLNNPTVPSPFRRPKTGDVRIGKYVLLYANVVICPGVTLHDGCVVAALTIVRGSVPAGVVVAGHDLREIGRRDVEQLRRVEQEYLASIRG